MALDLSQLDINPDDISPNDNVVPDSNRQRSYNGDYRRKGDFAEKMAWKFLEDSSYVVGIVDFRDLKPFHNADVDYGIEKTDGSLKLAEVKSDHHLGVSDNVLVEVARINHTARHDRCFVLGWTVRSPAHYIMYYASQLHTFYICETEALRKAFQKYTLDARNHSNMMIIPTDNIKSTLVVFVPMSYCQGIFKICKLSEEWLKE